MNILLMESKPEPGSNARHPILLSPEVGIVPGILYSGEIYDMETAFGGYQPWFCDVTSKTIGGLLGL